MARHLIVGGVDRLESDYIGGSLEIEAAMSYEIDTCKFCVRGDEPQWGQEVSVEDDDLDEALFAGTIVNVTGASIPSEPSTFVWDVSCDDFTALVSHKRVTGVFQNHIITELVRQLVADYTTGFTVEGPDDPIQAGRLAWDDVPLGQVLNDLAGFMGWEWYVDYSRVLHFTPVTTDLADAAPMILEPGGDFSNLKPQVDVQGVKNKVRVRGGLTASDYRLTRTFTGDGDTDTFILPHPKISDVTVTVDGIDQTVGIENLHEDEDFQWMMNYEQGYVRTGTATPPAAGLTVYVTYRRAVPVVAVVQDTVSQAAMAAALGTDGVIEGSVDDPSILSYDAAVAAGQAELRLWSNPQVSLDFDTYTPGWKPGQAVEVALPDRGIENDYLVQSVTVTAPTADHFNTKVQAGSTLKGLPDFMAALAKRNTQIVDTEQTVGRIESVTEVVTCDDDFSASAAAYAPAAIGSTFIIGRCEIA